MADGTDLVLSDPFYAPSQDGALDTLLSRRERLALPDWRFRIIRR